MTKYLNWAAPALNLVLLGVIGYKSIHNYDPLYMLMSAIVGFTIYLQVKHAIRKSK